MENELGTKTKMKQKNVIQEMNKCIVSKLSLRSLLADRNKTKQTEEQMPVSSHSSKTMAFPSILNNPYYHTDLLSLHYNCPLSFTFIIRGHSQPIISKLFRTFCKPFKDFWTTIVAAMMDHYFKVLIACWLCVAVRKYLWKAIYKRKALVQLRISEISVTHGIEPHGLTCMAEAYSPQGWWVGREKR